MSLDPYIRRVTPQRVIDGDSIVVLLDLGFRTYTENTLRLLAVDTPELNSRDASTRQAAQEAKAFTMDWLDFHRLHRNDIDSRWPFVTRSERLDSFGRFLGTLVCHQGHDLTAALIDSGHGVPA